MIIPDINLLIYATIDSFAEHDRARRWWEERLNGQHFVGLASVVIFGFIRIVTNPRIFDAPMTASQATAYVERWLERPVVQHIHGGQRYLKIAFDLIEQLGVAANLTTDVQLAALAIESQAELHSNDVDFARFPGLRWTNPLE